MLFVMFVVAMVTMFVMVTVAMVTVAMVTVAMVTVARRAGEAADIFVVVIATQSRLDDQSAVFEGVLAAFHWKQTKMDVTYEVTET